MCPELAAILLAASATSVLGVVFGALLHNTAAAISLSFALPIAFAVLGLALKSVADWIDMSTTFNWVLLGEWSGHVPQIAVSVALWIAIPLVLGVLRTVRREIN